MSTRKMGREEAREKWQELLSTVDPMHPGSRGVDVYDDSEFNYGAISMMASNQQGDVFILNKDGELIFTNLRRPKESRSRVQLAPVVGGEEEGGNRNQIPPEVQVHTISFNVTGDRLMLLGQQYLGVVVLGERDQTGMLREDGQGAVCVYHLLSHGDEQLFQASWHPFSSNHLVVLTGEQQKLSLYNTGAHDEDYLEAEIDLSRQLPEDVGCKTISFCFGSGGGWERFSIYLNSSFGEVYALCPVLPCGCLLPWAEVSALHEAERQFEKEASRLDQQEIEVRISWIEDRWPALTRSRGQRPNQIQSALHFHDDKPELQGPLKTFDKGQREKWKEGRAREVYSLEEHGRGDEGAVADSIHCLAGMAGAASDGSMNSAPAMLAMGYSSGEFEIVAVLDAVCPRWPHRRSKKCRTLRSIVLDTIQLGPMLVGQKEGDAVTPCEYIDKCGGAKNRGVRLMVDPVHLDTLYVINYKRVVLVMLPWLQRTHRFLSEGGGNSLTKIETRSRVLIEVPRGSERDQIVGVVVVSDPTLGHMMLAKTCSEAKKSEEAVHTNLDHYDLTHERNLNTQKLANEARDRVAQEGGGTRSVGDADSGSRTRGQEETFAKLYKEKYEKFEQDLAKMKSSTTAGVGAGTKQTQTSGQTKVHTTKEEHERATAAMKECMGLVTLLKDMHSDMQEAKKTLLHKRKTLRGKLRGASKELEDRKVKAEEQTKQHVSLKGNADTYKEFSQSMLQALYDRKVELVSEAESEWKLELEELKPENKRLQNQVNAAKAKQADKRKQQQASGGATTSGEEVPVTLSSAESDMCSKLLAGQTKMLAECKVRVDEISRRLVDKAGMVGGGATY
jgi:hypothetical protein